MSPEDKFPFGLVGLLGQPVIGDLAKEYAGVVADLRSHDPVLTAASFGALLVLPDLQANCYRIEALVHLASGYCQGRTAPGIGLVKRCFERLGNGSCGPAEDPAEDVFVSLVSTPNGNFRIFEGIREGTAFYLQRVLDVVQRLPAHCCTAGLLEKIDSLLKLSEAVAERLGVREKTLGEEMPCENMTQKVAGKLPSARSCIRFSERDLAALQISPTALSDLVFNPRDAEDLATHTIGHSELERRPLAFHGNAVYLLLPPAVATAITRLVIESILHTDTAAIFEGSLCLEYRRLFRETPLLGGGTRVDMMFQKLTGGSISSGMAEVDSGRFLHLVWVVDGLDEFGTAGGLAGGNANPAELSAAVEHLLSRASTEAKGRTGFRSGITLVVGCGYGRGLYFGGDAVPSEWRLELVSAYDLVTLAWLGNFDTLSLWRLLDSQEALARSGVELMNTNGLLNLVAWSRQLGGHVVAHGKLPDGFVDSSRKHLIVVEQNARSVLQWCEYVYVLREGQLAFQGTADECRANEELVKQYLSIGVGKK